jgi:cysteine desulfurase family protein (TIGR01976 family)
MTTPTQTTSILDTVWVRAQFPSLALEMDGTRVLYLDNPAGTQVPQQTIDGIANYLLTSNANQHGPFVTSQRTDKVIATARENMAAFLGAPSPNQIAFGPNMTTLTYNISRAIARTLSAGDEIIVTDLDHDAHITPWADLAALGGVLRRVPIRIEDCTLDLAAFASLLSTRTRLVAITHASNAVGTLTPIKQIARMVHDAGALIWVDAVHYGPHGPIDVQDLDVDFLVCSAYKFFGPHLGILYGRADLLEDLRSYHLRPAPHEVPERFETGTKNHECLAGLNGTFAYLSQLDQIDPSTPQARQAVLNNAMSRIRAYEQTLSAALLEGLSSVSGLRIYGITDPARISERVPTFAINLDGKPASQTAEALAQRGIFTWWGNYYALDIMQRLDLEGRGGAVRVGAVHYNTLNEVDRLVETLKTLQ